MEGPGSASGSISQQYGFHGSATLGGGGTDLEEGDTDGNAGHHQQVALQPFLPSHQATLLIDDLVHVAPLVKKK